MDQLILNFIRFETEFISDFFRHCDKMIDNLRENYLILLFQIGQFMVVWYRVLGQNIVALRDHGKELLFTS